MFYSMFTITMSIVLPNMEIFPFGDEELSMSFSFHCVYLNARNGSSIVNLGISETDISRLKRKERRITWVII